MFKVGSIRISGNSYLDTSMILESARVEMNQAMFEVNTADITNKLLKNKYIRGVSIAKLPPSMVRIDIQEREPLFYLVDNYLYMVDETGIMLRKLPGMPMAKLPLVTGLSVNQLLEDRTPLFQAIELTKKIHQVDEDLLSLISEIHIRKDKWPIIYLIKGGARVNLGEQNHFQRLYLLSEFLKREPIIHRLENISGIDLTFTDRIIMKKKI
ncbi:MAG: FtsQ-type POTRA domain-containing protein [candidate division Zixibacteria bacterium]|nr:FtsQ-type POTRA domain-containing protein [candidate division Zixibacteria bacterium]NIV07452.1 FtsQ-type POTRA domain-containing protein [candidate division Zixibacteria bacterium]